MKSAVKVIHLNEHIRSAGGVEVYIEQLQKLLPERGARSDWLGVKRSGKLINAVRYGHPEFSWKGDIGEFKAFLSRELRGGGLLHVHSISDPSIIRACFEVAPVIRTMHEPRMFCPGNGKFWSKSESPCTKAFGLHCLLHTYTEGCSNRHPKRLLTAMKNTHFEIAEASLQYKAIIANSNYIRKEAMLAGIPGEKIQVLPYFAEELETASGHIQAELSRIVFAGRLSRTKGLHYLLYAFVEVIKHVPKLKLDIAGSGIDQEFFIQLANELGIASSVIFHSWCDRSKISELMSGAAVVVFPSIYPEAFGIVGIEAMMRGKPVVAFDVGGVRDWLEDNKTGYIVRPKDIVGLQHALIHLLVNADKQSSMGKAARIRALQRFNIKIHMDALLKIYQKAAMCCAHPAASK